MSAESVTLGPNPIFVRETRVRWRGHAFLIIFSYVVLLAVVMLGIYWSSSHQIEVTPNPLRRMAQIGHSLFLNLSWMQTLGCLLLTPALTATSIAVEREQGLLESLQVAPLSAWQIVGGKLLSVLLFMGLLLLATLPIASLCFLMGGVSPAEFALAALLEATTVLTGATIGLFCSAWTRRANSAMTFTWIFVLLWGIGSFSAVIVASAVTHDWLTQLFGDTNPVLAVISLSEPHFRSRSLAIGSLDLAPWQISLAFQLLLTPLLLWLAVRGVRKPLHEPYWMEASRKPGKQPQTLNATPDAAQSLQGRQKALAAIERAAASSKASRWELPLLRRIHFANPLLQREVRSKFRVRRMPPWNVLLIGGVLMILAYWYLYGMIEVLNNPGEREPYWWTICFLGLIVLMIAASIMGAGGFTGERQNGTWEGLALSRLTPGQIITAKLVAPLLACFVYSIPLWPLLSCCLLRGSPMGPYSQRGITLSQATLTILIIAATTWCCIAWSLWLSWRSRRTATAAGWAVGTQIALYAFVPGFLFALADTTGSGQVVEQMLDLWHPFVALNSTIIKQQYHMNKFELAWICGLTQFMAGCVLLLRLHRAMRYGGREKDAAR